MKNVVRELLWVPLGLALFAAGCSSSSGKDDASVPDITPDGTPVGAPCTADDVCKGGVCYEQKCARACTAPTDCAETDECTSDDGKRLFCRAPTYAEGMGQPCVLTGTCPSKTLKCMGGKEYAFAYCTGECKGDLDCPAEYFCGEPVDGKRFCTRRGFCARCLYDAQCGTGNKCVKQGTAGSFCAKPCNAGKTECPRYAECKEVEGEHLCIHRSGACVGDGSLCTPCLMDEDCATDALCVAYIYSEEAFCTKPCPGGTGCPATGYSCESVTGPAGKVQQCIPNDPNEPKCVASLSPMGEVGDTMHDVAMVGYMDADKDGALVKDPGSQDVAEIEEQLQVIKMSDFADSAEIILFSASGFWCSACRSETGRFADLMTTYGPQGLLIFQVLVDGADQGSDPTLEELDAWVNSPWWVQQGMRRPVGAIGLDVQKETVPYNTDSTLPLNMILEAKTRKVLDKFNGFDEAEVEAKIKQHLGISP